MTYYILFYYFFQSLNYLIVVQLQLSGFGWGGIEGWGENADNCIFDIFKGLE